MAFDNPIKQKHQIIEQIRKKSKREGDNEEIFSEKDEYDEEYDDEKAGNDVEGEENK